MSDRQGAYQEAKANVSLLRWVFGWHPIIGPFMVLFFAAGFGYYFGEMYLFALGGLLLGGPIWYQGMRYINRHADSIREAYMADVEQYGPVVMEAAGMDEDAERHVLITTPDSTFPFIETPSKVEVTIVGVDDAGVWIFDETKLDLMFLNAKVSTDPAAVRRFPWTNLERAAYDEGEFVVEPIRETEDVWPFSRELAERPSAVLEAIHDGMESTE